MKTELTIEESAKLIELGVDPKLASGESLVGGKLFRLTDILNILPKEIDGSDLTICAKKDGWAVFYTGRKIRLSDTRVVAPELIDALYQLLCFCLERGFVKPKTDNQ